MNIIERIRQIIAYKNISTRKFCIEIGVANGFLDKVKDVGSEKVMKILNTYSEINPEWLILGNGEMLRGVDCAANRRATDADSVALYERNKELLQQIEDLRETIAAQRELIHELQEKNYTQADALVAVGIPAVTRAEKATIHRQSHGAEGGTV